MLGCNGGRTIEDGDYGLALNCQRVAHFLLERHYGEGRMFSEEVEIAKQSFSGAFTLLGVL